MNKNSSHLNSGSGITVTNQPAPTTDTSLADDPRMSAARTLGQQFPSRLQDDALLILILNNQQVLRPATELDRGAKLASGLMARKIHGVIPVTTLGLAEVTLVVGEGWANLGLKLNHELTAWATVAWAPLATEKVWLQAHAAHRLSRSSSHPSRPTIPLARRPPLPWMTVSFRPGVMLRLTPEQLSATLGLLWGSSYGIRRSKTRTVAWN